LATKYANATGNWSTMMWLDAPAGSVTTAPGVGDDADLNSKTVTIDQDVTLDNIVGAGALAISGNRTINANLGNSAATFSFTINNGSLVAAINGNIQASSTANIVRVTVYNVSSLVITGNITGGTGSSGMRVAGGSVSVVGNVTGGVTGTASSGSGIGHDGGSLTITGTVTGGSGTGTDLRFAGHGVTNTGGTLTLTGSLVDTNISAICNSASATFNYTPGDSDTVTIGGTTMYPTGGDGGGGGMRIY
jgi:hypothetical protein